MKRSGRRGDVTARTGGARVCVFPADWIDLTIRMTAMRRGRRRPTKAMIRTARRRRRGRGATKVIS